MKAICSYGDLAINGAPPVLPEPLHVGRPNIGNRDTFLAQVGEILDNQWLTNNGPVVQEFEKRVAQRLRVKVGTTQEVVDSFVRQMKRVPAFMRESLTYQAAEILFSTPEKWRFLANFDLLRTNNQQVA